MLDKLEVPNASQAANGPACDRHGGETLVLELRLQDTGQGRTALYRCTQCRSLVWGD